MRQIAPRTLRHRAEAAPVTNDITLSSVPAGQVASASGTVRNDVTLGAGATLTEPAGQSLSIFGDIVGPSSGAAAMLVSAGGTLLVAGVVPATVTVGFGGSGGTLALSSVFLPEMLASIAGFAPGDAIAIVAGTVTDAALTEAGTGEVLTLADEGTVVGTLTLADMGAAEATLFAIPDAIGDTRVVLGPPLPATSSTMSAGTPTGGSFVWNGGAAGTWSSAAAWHTAAGGTAAVAPGQHDTAAIAGGHASVLIVAGSAAAATLTTQGLVALTGSFTIGTLLAGATAADALVVAAGAQVAAASMTIEAGVVQVAAAGAALTGARAVVAPGGTLWVADSGSVSLGGLVLAGGVVRLGSTGTVSVAGAATAAAGTLGIGAGGVVAGAGTINGAVDNAGTVTANGTLQLFGAVTGNGTLAIGSLAELYLPDGAGAGQQVMFQGSRGTLELFGAAGTCAATVTGFGVGDVIDIASDTITQAVWIPGAPGAAGTLDLGSSGTLQMVVAASLSSATASFTTAPDGLGGTAIEVLPCFCAGTRLRRPGGTVAVEDLRVGDRLLTIGGAARVVRWIGWRRYTAAQLRRERQLRPVCLRPDALGPGVPSQELRLSPQHGIAVMTPCGLRLVPAVSLVDGRGVYRGSTGAAVTYFHVELDEHELLLTAGLVVESFRAEGAEDRSLFSGSAGLPGRAAAAVAPRLEDGQQLEAVRAAFRLFGTTGRAESDEWRGHVDRIARRGAMLEVAGWAATNMAGAEPLRLLVSCAGEARVAIANRWRPDLDRAGIAGGRAGFLASLPATGTDAMCDVRITALPACLAAAGGSARLGAGHRGGTTFALIG